MTIATVTLDEPGKKMVLQGIEQFHDFLPLPDGGRVQLTITTEDLDERFRVGVMIGYRQAVMLAHQQNLTAPATSRFFLVGRGGDGDWPFATEVNLIRPEDDPLRVLED